VGIGLVGGILAKVGGILAKVGYILAKVRGFGKVRGFKTF